MILCRCRLRNITVLPLLCLALLCPPISFSQVSSTPQPPVAGDKPVAGAELGMKDNPADPGAAAMILDVQVFTDDEGRVEKLYKRIKVFTEAGKELANVEIAYGGDGYIIEEVRARSISPDGKVVNFDGQLFDRVVAKSKDLKLSYKTFTIPGATIGSVLEYSYRVRWKAKLPDFIHNSAYFVADYTAALPTANWSVENDYFTKHEVFTFRPAKNTTIRTSPYLLGDRNVERTPDGMFRFEAQDVPAFVNEEYSYSDRSLRASVAIYYIVGRNVSGSEFWFINARNLGKSYDEYIGKSKVIQQRANGLISPADTSEQKLRKIYDSVQKIKNMSYEPSMTEKEQKKENIKGNKSVEEMLKHDYAWGNEINLLFVALARAAGFTATPVMVVPRERIFSEDRYDLSQFSGMVVRVVVDGKEKYLDPATPKCPYDLLPWNESGTTGLLADPITARFIATPLYRAESAVIERNASLRLKPDGTLDGSIEVQYKLQEALHKRLAFIGLDEAARKKKIEDDVKLELPVGAVVESESVTGLESTVDPLRLKFKVTLPAYAVRTSKRIMFSPAIFQSRDKQILTHEKRKFPIYFGHAVERIDHLVFELPEKSALEGVPSPERVDIGLAKFNWYCRREPGDVPKVICERHFTLDGFAFEAKSYSALKSFLQKARESDDRTLIVQNAGAN